MGSYLAVRDHLRHTLANLHASLDLDEGWERRRDADEALTLARRTLRRWPLSVPERRELSELATSLERVRSALPLAA